jgi:tetratricopeptide (TPR) repeat protein
MNRVPLCVRRDIDKSSNLKKVRTRFLIFLVLAFLLGCSRKDIKSNNYFDKGMEYYSKKAYAQAIEEFSKGIDDESIPSASMVAQMYAKRAECYYYKGDYEKSWADVHSAAHLKYRQFDPAFIAMLKKVSMREE